MLSRAQLHSTFEQALNKPFSFLQRKRGKGISRRKARYFLPANPLAEEFVDGPELNVAVLATAPEQFVTLPISEIVFSKLPDPKYHILTYEAKWMTDSPYYRSTVPRCPAELFPSWRSRSGASR